MLVLLSHLKLQKSRPQRTMSMEKAFNSWVEGTNGKRVLADGSALCGKALSLHRDFSRGSPEMGDTRPLTASKEQPHRCRNGFDIVSRRHEKEGEYSTERFWESTFK